MLRVAIVRGAVVKGLEVRWLDSWVSLEDAIFVVRENMVGLGMESLKSEVERYERSSYVKCTSFDCRVNKPLATDFGARHIALKNKYQYP